MNTGDELQSREYLSRRWALVRAMMNRVIFETGPQERDRLMQIYLCQMRGTERHALALRRLANFLWRQSDRSRATGSSDA